jgi:sphingomyelin phosphodiesterase
MQGKTIFPLHVTNPKTTPTANLIYFVVLPPSILESSHSPVLSPPRQNHSTTGSVALRPAAFAQMSEVHDSTTFNRSYAQCPASLLVARL